MSKLSAFMNSKEPDENITYLINLGTAINTGVIVFFILMPMLLAIVEKALHMIVTTIAALLWQSLNPKGFFLGPEPDLFLGISCLLIVLLAVYVSMEGIRVLVSKRTAHSFHDDSNK